jgi:hypothetical protein
MAFDRGDSQVGVSSVAILPVEQGGTNASTAQDARTNLGLVIGSDVQGFDATTLKSADIGVSVQGFDVDTAKLDVAQTFTQKQTFGSIEVTNGWEGSGTSSGKLGGIVQSFACERTTPGTATNVMAFGNGLSTGKGLRMPFAGKLLAATLSGINVNGTITVDAYLNGSANSSYRLTGTGSSTDIGVTQNFQSSPLSFAAGDTLGWYQTTVPTTANGYVVSFYVIFD